MTMSYTRNPNLWQASSHPELANRKPEELFQPEYVGVYRLRHRDLWQRMERLHGTIVTLETLEDFPFEFLYGPGHMEFWRLVGANFVESTIVSLHSLVNDQTNDANTIQTLRDGIAKATWVDIDKKKLFFQTLRDRKFQSDHESVASRIEKIRHMRIGHRLVNQQTGNLKDQLDGVSLQEFRSLFDAAHLLFGALSFGSGYVTLAGDWMPSTIGGKPTPTCLDTVLNAIIRDSHIVKRSDCDEPWWPAVRKHMDPAELKLMNELRVRVGEPEV